MGCCIERVYGYGFGSRDETRRRSRRYSQVKLTASHTCSLSIDADISDLKAEAQKYIDDASELKQKDSDFLLDAKSEEHRADNRCVPGYEIALAVSVVVTLMITSTAAAAVYWNVKHMRKQMFLHP